jgi:CRISPR-associated endonuclease/helicase Cas3
MTFGAFWGKAQPVNDAGPRMHPLWMHSLDVAAVGMAILRHKPDIAARIASALGWPTEDLVRLWSFALALHDLGKFSRPFQAKAPDHWPAEILGPMTGIVRDPGHSGSGLHLLMEPLADLTRRWFPNWNAELVFSFMVPVVGHHGRPIEAQTISEAELFGKASIEAARSYADAVEGLLAPPHLQPPPKRALARSSWLLAGLAVLADWVGSNQVWFPYQCADFSLEGYWREHALRRAEAAVAAARIPSSKPSIVTGFRPLTGLPYAPTPVQSWAESAILPDGPLLVLVEDMTGGGKTEAALILAHRLMAAGRAHGLYFALPTMATANAMFARLQECYRRLFADDEQPLLLLSHGRSRNDPRFAVNVLGTSKDWRAEAATRGNSEETDSAAEGPAWLADDRRKAFFADIGVGTVDQALLSVLPAKHQALRLLGLAHHVLIVDEAHAYDAYMGMELDRLIAFQAALGGHTIVLSATLPAATKERFAGAFAKAVGVAAQPIAIDDYPCVTLLSATVPPVVAGKPPRPELKREIAVTRIADEGTAMARIRAAADAGAAVAWIRNSVDDAIEGYERLQEAGTDVRLFHARFAFGDRYAIEEDVVRRFGKEGDPAQRRGKVLVATQVIEQSLDVDFDFVVSDLAPVDLLLQRAGRLWRHPDRRRPIEGPELAILSPDPVATVDEKWMTALLPRAGAVYRDHLLLWRSARVLFEAGRIRVPEDVRPLVEAAYGPDAETGAPEALARNRQKAVGDAKAQRSFAEQNLLRVEFGYRLDSQPWLDEARIATRLGEETRILRLARWDGIEFTPWCYDPDPRRAWALSEVSVRGRRVSGVPAPTSDLAEAVRKARQDWGRYDEDKLLLPMEKDANGHWIGSVTTHENRDQRIEYSPLAGLRFRTLD